MIRSMTGYARSESQGPWGRLSWEMRGVNHRYLDLQFKLPDDFRSLENEFRNQATAHVARGKVECGLRYQREAAAGGSISIDETRLLDVRAALGLISQTLTAVALPDALKVLSYPGVTREESLDTAPMLKAARVLFDETLKDFTDTRTREGQRLGEFLVERCDALQVLAAHVRDRYAQVRGLWWERMRGRARELGVEVDPLRLEQELVIVLQRLDVEEEISRLLSHLLEVRATLDRPEPVGRRLDFLMQELNREANTLSSKSQDAEMTRHAVEMKVSIEQMREQVQNIE
ncbi:MAG: hypothetical protein JWQ90_2793 [Hydrocarboniphaga sp.]|uniref:YicC/YloC family endoribonuclease n=1 Tax=Hydrocarboniphaga sp. TaxID=2033016 RepID=UPI002637D85C|nr:YicC/YloC family endoribonuclease [Hydrocarboniphaga sp.]MDB5970343.1 hypothetical protein [Hydrocarboniphaga sp.]